MRNYPKVPDWWYELSFVVFFSLSWWRLRCRVRIYDADVATARVPGPLGDDEVHCASPT
jgi:hypothetical protein